MDRKKWKVTLLTSLVATGLRATGNRDRREDTINSKASRSGCLVMAFRRSTQNVIAVFALIFGLLMEGPAAASISLTPHASYKKNFKWSRFKRFFRQSEVTLGADLMEQVENATREEARSQPNPLVVVSKTLQEGVDCSSLSLDLHRNHINSSLRLRPKWIHRSQRLGECPTRLVTRELRQGFFPPVVMEAMCVCEGSRCAEDGHHCVRVTHDVPVWVRKGRKYKKLEPVELTVGCVCARKTLPEEHDSATSLPER